MVCRLYGEESETFPHDAFRFSGCCHQTFHKTGRAVPVQYFVGQRQGDHDCWGSKPTAELSPASCEVKLTIGACLQVPGVLHLPTEWSKAKPAAPPLLIKGIVYGTSIEKILVLGDRWTRYTP
ncbi:hypothetical protein PoB_003571900 [Plakobranchus ocellatus]|uniref:Uncharacterized protein n=1 Tax=Plakobranchus ocellatus TaxID=259542 RepID=A0AAV4AN38_9GAST|nr:hypothetical protein PoB_003571900 [Plakobranchus ocellatus]